jgi:hypothetical protein
LLQQGRIPRRRPRLYGSNVGLLERLRPVVAPTRPADAVMMVLCS